LGVRKSGLLRTYQLSDFELVRHRSISLLLGGPDQTPSGRGPQELLFSCFAGRVTGITGGLALGLQLNLICCLFSGCTSLLLSLLRCKSLTLCGNPGILGNPPHFPLGHASIPRSTHGGPSSPPLRNLRVIRTGLLTKLCRHRLLCVPSGTQPLAKIFLLHSTH
jgi:hypothetical protein